MNKNNSDNFLSVLLFDLKKKTKNKQMQKKILPINPRLLLPKKGFWCFPIPP